MEKIRLLIIGGGPAGYTAAIYASRAALSPVLYEGMEPGGQLTTTTVVENYPGFTDGVDANKLMGDMRAQAVRLGADVRRGTVVKADLSSKPFRFTLDGGEEIEAEAVIIATGAVGTQVPGHGRVGLRHLRRILLQEEGRRRGGRR